MSDDNAIGNVDSENALKPDSTSTPMLSDAFDAIDTDAIERATTGPQPVLIDSEPAVYPGPAESPETPPNLFPRQVWRADMERDWYGLSALRLAAERRIRSIGITQWTDTARGLEQMACHVSRDEMYLVREGPTAVGCFALTDIADMDFWADDPERDECLYMHKVITAPWAAGTGVGQFITEYALAETKARKCTALRLDCQRGNGKLKEHLESLGFTYLRTIEANGRDNGMLMEQRLP